VSRRTNLLELGLDRSLERAEHAHHASALSDARYDAGHASNIRSGLPDGVVDDRRGERGEAEASQHSEVGKEHDGVCERSVGRWKSRSVEVETERARACCLSGTHRTVLYT
jgi:hypothetical protein